MISILVADDHPVVRSGIRHLLRDDPDMRVAAEAHTGAEVLLHVGRRSFDVLLLDVRLPDVNGLDLIARLRRDAPAMTIVMFTHLAGESARAFQEGAHGFLLKDASFEQVKRTIETAVVMHLAGGGSAIASQHSIADAPAHQRLSNRELEVMLKLIDGRRPKEIAAELGVSDKTINTHYRRMKAKLGVADTRGLIVYAMRNGLMDWHA